MNRFKFQAFIEEFPALQEILTDDDRGLLSADQVDGVCVKRWTKDLFTCRAVEYSRDGSLVDSHSAVLYHAVMLDGSMVRNFVEPDYTASSNYAYSGTIARDGETVLEALDRLKSVPTLIVMVEREYNDTRGQDLVDERHVVVYKAAMDVDIAVLIVEARERARREVAAEVAF